MKGIVIGGWGDFNYQEEPIFLDDFDDEAERNLTCEKMIKEYLEWCKPQTDGGKRAILPGYFTFIKGREEELRRCTIRNYLKVMADCGKCLLITPAFAFMTNRYDTTRHVFDVSEEEDEILTNLGGRTNKMVRISIRIGRDLAGAIRALTKRGIGDLIDFKITNFLLNNFFKIGGLHRNVKMPFKFAFHCSRHLIGVDAEGLSLIDVEGIAERFTYSAGNKGPLLVDFRLADHLAKGLRIISETRQTTITALFNEAFVGT